MTVLAYSATAQTAVNPDAEDTKDVATGIVIPGNHFSIIEANFTVKIAKTGSAVANVMTFDIRDGTDVLVTRTVTNTVSVAESDHINIRGLFALQKGSSNLNLFLRVASAADDTAVTVTCVDYIVIGHNVQVT